MSGRFASPEIDGSHKARREYGLSELFCPECGGHAYRWYEVKEEGWTDRIQVCSTCYERGEGLVEMVRTVTTTFVGNLVCDKSQVSYVITRGNRHAVDCE